MREAWVGTASTRGRSNILVKIYTRVAFGRAATVGKCKRAICALHYASFPHQSCANAPLRAVADGRIADARLTMLYTSWHCCLRQLEHWNFKTRCMDDIVHHHSMRRYGSRTELPVFNAIYVARIIPSSDLRCRTSHLHGAGVSMGHPLFISARSVKVSEIQLDDSIWRILSAMLGPPLSLRSVLALPGTFTFGRDALLRRRRGDR